MITDSSTIAAPATISPSAGMISCAGTSTSSPLRSSSEGTVSVRPVGPQPAPERLLAPAPERVGLGLAAPLGQRLGEVGEEHREPEPDADLDDEAQRLAVRPGAQDLDRGDERADLGHEHDRVADHVARVELGEAGAQGGEQDLRARTPNASLAVVMGVSSRVQKVRVDEVIRKCSTIGPTASDGKNVSAPTMMTVEVSSTTNVGPVTGKLPASAAVAFFCDERARQREHRDRREEAPEQDRQPLDEVPHDVAVGGRHGQAGERRAVVADARGEGVEHLGEAARPAVVEARRAPAARRWPRPFPPA